MRHVWTLLLTATLTAGCGKHWTPPRNPNPQSILNEAEADAKAGNYEDALAKQVWFYQNALKHDPAMRGVRVSFALSSWAQLGESYPPALAKLKAVRDEAAENVRQGKDPVNAFQDFVAINSTIKDDDDTSQFFAWLDANKPVLAQNVFDRTQNWLLPALVRTKKYALCGKYIDPNTSFEQILRLYRTMMEQVNQGRVGGEIKDFADKNFISKTTTLIAILVVDGRKADAQQIADRISKEPNLPEFKDEIQKALNGEVPAPWP